MGSLENKSSKVQGSAKQGQKERKQLQNESLHTLKK